MSDQDRREAVALRMIPEFAAVTQPTRVRACVVKAMEREAAHQKERYRELLVAACTACEIFMRKDPSASWHELRTSAEALRDAISRLEQKQ